MTLVLLCQTNVQLQDVKETTALLIAMYLYSLPTDPELRHKWIRALHLVDINQYTYACEKHFRDEDIARSYSVPSGTNGTLKKFPRKVPVLRKSAVQFFAQVIQESQKTRLMKRDMV